MLRHNVDVEEVFLWNKADGKILFSTDETHENTYFTENETETSAQNRLDSEYQRLREQYVFQKRGVIQVKGKGGMLTYLLVGRKPCV